MKKNNNNDIDTKKFIEESNKIKREIAKQKAPSRILIGQTILNNPELGEKWAKFVVDSSNGINHGNLLDETLHIMGLIKLGTSPEKIKENLLKIPNNKVIINYLREFFDTEIINEIDLYNNTEKNRE